MANEKPLYTLYKGLKANNYDVPESYDSFERTLTSGGQGGSKYASESRHILYNALKSQNFDVPDTYESFYSTLFEPVSSTTSRAKGGNAVGAAKQPPTRHATGKPLSAHEKAAMIGRAQGLVDTTNASISRTKNIIDYNKANSGLDVKPTKVGFNSNPSVVLGQNRKVVKKQEYNPALGNTETQYLTESGNEYENRALADLEQNTADDYRRRLINPMQAQLEDAYAERDDIDQKLKERRAELDKQQNERPFWQRLLMEGSKAMHSTVDPMSTANDPEHKGYENDEQYMQLMSAARKNHQTIQTLEDKKNGKMNNFWHGLATAAANGYTFTDGMSELRDETAINYASRHLPEINRKRKTGEALTRKEQAAEKILKANAEDNRVQSLYGDDYGAWSRAGGMMAQSLDFMKDFLLTPGAGGMAKGIAKSVAGIGGEALAKVAGESIVKSVPKAIARGALKATGVVLGAHTAGAIISNTTGIGRTMANMAHQTTGQLSTDDQGNYKIEGGKNLLHAFAEAERQQMRENGSEMFGEFIPGGKALGGLAKKGLEKIGLSKISNALTSMGSKQWYKTYAGLLKKGGYNGIPGEALEEYEGIAFDALTGHGQEALESLTDKRQNVDIWLGCATMGALMGAVPLAYHASGYYVYKHKMDKSDKKASLSMPPGKWEPLKELIDQTDNSKMTDFVVENIIQNEGLSHQEKTAALDYVDKLTKYRGFNIAQVSNAGDKETLQHQPVNDSYTKGYNATGKDMAQVKKTYDEARRKMSSFASDVFVDELDRDPIGAYLKVRNNEQLNELSKQDALDYINAKVALDGVFQRAKDDMDDRVTESDAMVDSRVNREEHGGDGMIHPATMKMDDRQVYVVSGHVAMTEDGSMVDSAKSAESVIIRDAQSGKVEMVSPSAILRVDDAIDPEQEKKEAAETICQSFVTERANQIDGILDNGHEVFVPGDDGQPVKGVVTGYDADEGQYMVETEQPVGGNIVQPFAATQVTSALQDRAESISGTDGQSEETANHEANVPTNEGSNIVDRQNTVQGTNSTEDKTAVSPENNNFATARPMTTVDSETRSAETPTQPEAPVHGGQSEQNADTLQPEQNTETQQPEQDSQMQEFAPTADAPMTAMSRIPVAKDAHGNAIIDKKTGVPAYRWHEASVEDATDALTELNEGSLINARDTAQDMEKVTQDKLSGLRKQKAKGSDPVSISRSRQQIRQQVEDAEKELLHWRKVKDEVNRRMNVAQQQRTQEVEAAKSEEQKAVEEEAKRKAMEAYEERERIERKKAINREAKARNKEYAPLAQAKKDFADDPEAMEILNDTEPRDLEETVSSMLRPNSIVWNDYEEGGATARGLQSELRLKISDINRFRNLLGRRENGAKSLAGVAEDIWMDMSEAMQERYTDQDVKNTILDLFRRENSGQMRNVTAENRIEQARQVYERNREYEAEAALMAYAEAHHIRPDEVEDFKDWLEQMFPDIIIDEEMLARLDEIFAEQLIQEEYERSHGMGGRPESTGVDRGNEESESSVRGAQLGESGIDTRGAEESDPSGAAESDSGKAVFSDGVYAQEGARGVEASHTEEPNEPMPIGKGVFGNIYDQFKGKAKEAIDFLRLLKSGEAIGALHHKDIGDIALVWGNAKAGLQKIVHKHPEVVNNLQEIIDAMHIVQASDNRIKLESDTHYAVVSRDWFGEKRTPWLLTAYEKKESSAINNTMDTADTQKGKRNDTATPQDAASAGKDTQSSDTKQEKEDIFSMAERIAKEYEQRREMEKARKETETNPTEAQKEAGNYKKGHMKVDGMNVTIENPKGSIRSGKDANGKEWSIDMNYDYGYIRGTEGVDGDHIDVYLSEKPSSGNVYVVDQIDQKTGKFDEHKVMYGFPSMEAAREAYASQYEDGWKIGTVTEVSREEFKKWVDSSKRKMKPFSEYKGVKVFENGYRHDMAVNGTEGDESEGKKTIGLDRQGNPIDANGKLVTERVGSVAELTDDDFLHPTRSVELPAIPKNVADAIGSDGKPVVIKKNIFEKNHKGHADLTPYQSREILSAALYNPDLYGQNQKTKRPFNWVVINTKDVHGHNRIVLLEVNEKKEHVEIVHWHYIDARGLEKIERQAEREGGQLLILPSDNSKEAGALSSLTDNLSSAGKDSKVSDTKQGKLLEFDEENLLELKDFATKTDSSKRTTVDEANFDSENLSVPLLVNGKPSRLSVATVVSDVITNDSGQIALYDYSDEIDDKTNNGWQKWGDLSEAYNEQANKADKAHVRGDTATLGFMSVDAAVKFHDWMSLAEKQQGADVLENDTEARQVATEAVITALGRAGIDVVMATEEQAAAIFGSDRGNVKLHTLDYGGSYTYLPVEEDLPRAEKQIVYHGSGAKFDAFDSSHMGEGEGAQAYGWGHYVTEVEGIGRTYAENTSVHKDKPVRLNGIPILKVLSNGDYWDPNFKYFITGYETSIDQLVSHVNQAYIDGREAGSRSKRVREFKRQQEKLLSLIDRGEVEILHSPRQLYTVDILDDIGSNYLQWEKPLTEEQLSLIGRRLEADGWTRRAMDVLLRYEKADKKILLNPKASGADVYEELKEAFESAERASLFLGAIGFTGISYPAQYRSGGREDGKRNYVIFNDGDLKIVDRVEFMRTGSKKISASETASPENQDHHTVVSSADGAKVLKGLDNLVKEYENFKGNKPNTFIGDAARALGAKRHGSASEYVTFETVNGRVVTIRVANHNAKVSAFDNHGESEGISIVISPKGNSNLVDDGHAHVMEYYYDAIKLRRADGKPLVEILKSIKQVLYSGEYKDTTGLAEVQEVNADSVSNRQSHGGTVYGWTVGGKIYLTQAGLNPNTPIHEYTHLWAAAMRRRNAAGWESIKKLLKGTPVWDEVMNDENYADIRSDEDAVASEALSRISGRENAVKMEAQAQKLIDEAKDVFGKAEAVTLLDRMRRALSAFWKWIGTELFDIREFVSIDEVTDRVLYDLVSGTDLKAGPSFNVEKQIMQDDVATDEEDGIIARAKADGSYMKAPNGEPSQLSVKQWVQVRTQAFKQWFGDWEKAARVDKLRNSKPVMITGEEYKGKYELNRDSAKAWIKDNLRGEYVIADTGEKVFIGRKGVNKVTSHSMANDAHLKSLVAVPLMLSHSIFITEEKAEKVNAQYPFYRYYVVGLNIDGVDYTAKLTIGVDANGNKYYDHALTEIGKGKLLDQINGQAAVDGFISTGAKPNPSVTTGKDSKLVSILQTNSSKVLDENGEPLVVYHGTLKNGLRKFNKDFIGSRYGYDDKGVFFISLASIAKDYATSEFDSNRKGEVIPIYINLKTPLVVDSQWCKKNGLGSKVFDNNDVIEFWDNYQSLMIEESENNDGVVITDGKTTMVVAFEPNQIKSATENTGAFSNKEDDIRYRHGDGALTDDELSYENDPVAKMLGKSTRTAKQQKEFAERERNRMAERVQELAQVLHLDNVEVVTDNSLLEGKKAKAKGFFSKSTGKITVVIPNHTSVEDAERTLLHEAVAHYGLRRLFGKHFDTFLDNVYRNADEDIRREIVRLAGSHGWDFRTTTEEYLAGLAEDTNFEYLPDTFWSKIKRLFLQMLHSIGFENWYGPELSDNELRYILWRSYENLKEPGRHRSILGEAADVAKQYELKVGNYEEREDRQSLAADQNLNAGVSEKTVDEVNKRFNAELQQQIDGELPKGHVYSLGMPSALLRSAGFPNVPIELSATRLAEKSKQDNHIFNLSEVKNLVKELNHPWAIFRYGNNAKNVIIGIEHNGKQFLVGIHFNQSHRGTEISDIRGIFPKDNAQWLNWIAQGKTDYINKQKIQTLINQQRINLAEVEYLDLDSVTKIIENFESPVIDSEKIGDDVLFRDGDINFSTRDRAIARDEYERIVSSGSYQFQEAVQDSMLGLKKLYQSILGKNKRIEEVEGFENAYLAENEMSSTTASQQHVYYMMYMKPLLNVIGKLTGSNKTAREELTDYMMAKHGLERNEVMARRDAHNKVMEEYGGQLRLAEKAVNEDPLDNNAIEALDKLKMTINEKEDELYSSNRERDYAGLTALTNTEDVVEAEAAAKQMVDDYERDHDTGELWKTVKAATGATLEKIYRSGLLSKERYDDINSMYEYYIPLQGWDEKTSDEVYGYLTSKGGPLMGSPIKRAKGRTSKADDPIATIALMADTAISKGNRNLMKQTFLNFVQNHPSDLVSVNSLWLHYNEATDEWEPVFADIKDTDSPDEVEQKINAFDEHMKQLAEESPESYKRGKETQNVPYKVVRGNMKEHQILVKRNGMTYVLTINGNPRAAQALNGLTNPDVERGDAIGKLLKVGEYINRQLSAFYTTRNPDFVMSNFMRDTLYSNCMTWVKESPRYAMRFHYNFGRVNPARMRQLLGKWENGTLDESNEMERMFKQFMLHGGETGYTSVKDIEGHKRDIAAELKRQESSLRSGLHAVGLQMDLLNRSVENCARFAAFVTSRQEGRSIVRSVYDAKEVSVNFNKKGSGGKMVNATGQTVLGKFGSYLSGYGRVLYVFWNAGVQGMTNVARASKRNPMKATAAAASMFVLGVVVPMLAQAMGGGDDDDKNSYYNLPEYIRRSNIVIKAGNKWVTIALPIEFRAIYGLGELATGVISGKERYSNSELAFQLGSQISQVAPLDILESGGGLPPFVPSLAKPVSEVARNKSWTGLPIYRDNDFNKMDPEWTKAYKNANSQLVGTAKWLNEISGGDDYKKGVIDINPAMVEHLLSGYFGGFFTTANKFVKMGQTAIGSRDFDWRNMILANRLIKTGDERTEARKLTNEYFKYKDEYEETHRLLKKYTDASTTNSYYGQRLEELKKTDDYLRHEVFDGFKPIMDGLYDAKKDASGETYKNIENEENSLRSEMVDMMHAIEDDKHPDIDKGVDNMLQHEFEAKGLTSKAAGSKIASRIGGRDSYGSPQNEYGKIYLRKRDYFDLAEDVLLQVEEKKAKDSGNQNRAKAIDSARRQLTEIKKGLGYGDDDNVMQDLRAVRKDMLQEFGISNAMSK